jgi:hypothetical protein
VDVDILFQEKSKIKEKIKLSEQIVKAVRNMQCPASIQAHQIQPATWWSGDRPDRRKQQQVRRF